ncbi:WhiB family transcriptional regulator [Nocardiopsis sp. NPDC006139]|uniref:WhiB family transcriptional regulator n=1 Tax=Nocardiopsis sp. NPDC006139 TaxID=3154578 RepID=UPI0033B9EBA9
MRRPKAAGVRDQRTTPTAADHSWTRQAVCAGMSLELFFGPPGERQPAKSLREDEAVAVCAWCPVRSDCLDDALTYHPKQQHGVVGGMTAEERIAERRKRQRRVKGAA